MDYVIEGMHCAACAARIEGALTRLPGVIGANVNYATHKARVSGDVAESAVVELVADLGYGAKLATGVASDGSLAARGRRRELIAAAALTLPVFLLGMSHRDFPGNGFIQLVLTAVLLAWPGRGFFIRAARTVRFGGATMDTLVALGSGAAFVASLFALAFGTSVYYFESAAVIVTLVLLGQHLEENARHGSTEAIRKLRALQPSTARVRAADGSERAVGIAEVRIGDLFIVRPGERVAVDGVVVEGETALDEALVTGESMPVIRRPGDAVIGTTVNAGSAALVIRCSAEPGKTVLASIVSLVEDAQASKANVQRLADRVARWFVPVVLALALGTLVSWYVLVGATLSVAVLHAVAVLVIACPCALGLATPTAILAGTGRAAEELILIRSAPGLERAEALTVAVVDKTGTLTEGRPAVTAVHIEPDFLEKDVVALVGAAEGGSAHPLARALSAYAERSPDHLLTVRTEFAETSGRGIRARVRKGGREHEVLIGTQAFLAAGGVASSPDWAAATDRVDGQVFVGVDGKAAALFTVDDPIRASTPAALEALRKMGLAVVMATGDRRATAMAVAKRLGITAVHAELLPAGKLELIKSLQASGARVCMVGDGLNDAPALTQADVGIALGGGADIAEDAADLVIPHGNLAKIADAIYISRRTMRVIRQNLVWAFTYNVLAIPLAASGHLSPMIAAGVMAISSLSVVGNSLRLRHLKGAAAA